MNLLRKLTPRLGKRRLYKVDLVPATELQRSYEIALEWIIKNVGVNEVGDYFEFGVCRGTSMICMWNAMQKLKLTKPRLFGFDSFEGLPANASDDDGGKWKAGQFDSDEQLTRRRLSKAGIDWCRTFLFSGWFDKTMTPELIAEYEMNRVGVVMIDCDMYKSTKTALDWLEPLLNRHFVFVFDDWNSWDLASQGLGEKRAFDELIAQHPDIQIVEELPGYNSNSRVFYLKRDK